MGFLKGFATFIFSLLFFVVLIVFSVAFLVNGTVLSYDFVASEVNKMPVSFITHDIAENQLSGQLPPGSEYLKEVVYNVVNDQESWIKTRIKAALQDGYNYFEGRTNYFSITVPMTDLKNNLRGSLWPEYNSYLHEQLAGKSDYEISSYLQNVISQIPLSFYPYDIASLPTNQRNLLMEQYLRDGANIPPKLGVPAIDPSAKSELDVTFANYIDAFVNNINDSYTVDETTIDASTIQTLRDARQGVIQFHFWYPWLIVLLVVLAGLIFLVNWSIKGPALALGINLIVIGVIDLVVFILIRTLPIVQWVVDAANVDVSPALATWIQGMINDIAGVMLPLTIGILVAGVVLLILGIVLPRKQKAVPVPSSNYPPPTTAPPQPPPPPPT